MAAVSLQAFWTSAKHGSLAPCEQAKVWAMNWVMDTYGEKYDFKIVQEDIAKAVTKVGGGHPDQPVVSKLLKIVRSDPKWYPGKLTEGAQKRGRKRTFTGQKQQAVASCAMAIKRSGYEPTAAAVKQRCPAATMNPDTEEPYTDKYIYQVFSSRCRDDGAEDTWSQLTPHSKTALSPEMQTMRLRGPWAAAL